MSKGRPIVRLPASKKPNLQKKQRQQVQSKSQLMRTQALGKSADAAGRHGSGQGSCPMNQGPSTTWNWAALPSGLVNSSFRLDAGR